MGRSVHGIGHSGEASAGCPCPTLCCHLQRAPHRAMALASDFTLEQREQSSCWCEVEYRCQQPLQRWSLGPCIWLYCVEDQPSSIGQVLYVLSPQPA